MPITPFVSTHIGKDGHPEASFCLSLETTYYELKTKIDKALKIPYNISKIITAHTDKWLLWVIPKLRGAIDWLRGLIEKAYKQLKESNFGKIYEALCQGVAKCRKLVSLFAGKPAFGNKTAEELMQYPTFKKYVCAGRIVEAIQSLVQQIVDYCNSIIAIIESVLNIVRTLVGSIIKFFLAIYQLLLDSCGVGYLMSKIDEFLKCIFGICDIGQTVLNYKADKASLMGIKYGEMIPNIDNLGNKISPSLLNMINGTYVGPSNWEDILAAFASGGTEAGMAVPWIGAQPDYLLSIKPDEQALFGDLMSAAQQAQDALNTAKQETINLANNFNQTWKFDTVNFEPLTNKFQKWYDERVIKPVATDYTQDFKYVATLDIQYAIDNPNGSKGSNKLYGSIVKYLRENTDWKTTGTTVYEDTRWVDNMNPTNFDKNAGRTEAEFNQAIADQMLSTKNEMIDIMETVLKGKGIATLIAQNTPAPIIETAMCTLSIDKSNKVLIQIQNHEYNFNNFIEGVSTMQFVVPVPTARSTTPIPTKTFNCAASTLKKGIDTFHLECTDSSLHAHISDGHYPTHASVSYTLTTPVAQLPSILSSSEPIFTLLKDNQNITISDIVGIAKKVNNYSIQSSNTQVEALTNGDYTYSFELV